MSEPLRVKHQPAQRAEAFAFQHAQDGGMLGVGLRVMFPRTPAGSVPHLSPISLALLRYARYFSLSSAVKAGFRSVNAAQCRRSSVRITRERDTDGSFRSGVNSSTSEYLSVALCSSR